VFGLGVLIVELLTSCSGLASFEEEARKVRFFSTAASAASAHELTLARRRHWPAASAPPPS
jgi:hypothetical protein